MNKINALLFFTLLSYSCGSQIEHNKATYAIKNLDARTIKLIDGHWFNGEAFEKKTVWLNEGLLSFKSDGRSVDSVINLSNKYIIPPFAEAHNHNLESSYELDRPR